MPPQSNAWGFNFRATSGYLTDPANTTYVLGTDTPSVTRSIGADSVTFGWSAEVSARNRSTTAAGGKLGGFHWKENAAAGSTDFIVTLSQNGVWAIELGRCDITDGPRVLGKIEIYDNATLLHTIEPRTQTALVTDAAATDFVDASAWEAGSAAIELEFASNTLKMRCYWDFDEDEEFWLAHLQLTQISPGEPTYKLWIDGVEDEDGDDGTGAAFMAAVAAKAASGGGGSVLLSPGTSDEIVIELASKWTLPANDDGDVILLGLKTSTLDSVIAIGAVRLPNNDLFADLVVIAYTVADSNLMIDAAIGAHSYHWQGVIFDYGAGVGNVAVTHAPAAVLDGESAEHDAYVPADQPNDWKFDRCGVAPRNFGTPSFQYLKFAGKRVEIVDWLSFDVYTTGGQGDGYIFTGDVGDGPLIITRPRFHNIGGEVWGWGSHGQRGGGTPGVGDPGYLGMAAALHQPLNQGMIATQGVISRDLADRRYFYSSSSVVIGTGSKTFTVPTGMVFVDGEDIYCDGFGGNTMTGTVTSYNAGTGALVVNIASVNGSGTKTIWTIRRDDVLPLYKNHLEVTYGQDIVIEGFDFSSFWVDSGGQYAALIFKLSTMALAGLNHVALRRVTIRHCVFRGLFQLLAVLDDVSTASNPAQTDFSVLNCVVLDLNQERWGGEPSTGGIIGLGTDMPANVRIRHCLINSPAGTPRGGLISIGTAGAPHPSIAVLTGLDLRSNIIALSGVHPYGEFTGYFGPDTLITSSAHFLETACAAALCSHNSIVTGDVAANYGGYADDNTFYAGPSGRTALLAKFAAPSEAVVTDQDWRYLEGEEETGHDGDPRGPDWVAMHLAMGIAWPFSWVPTGAFLPLAALQARAGIARSGVTHAGWTPPNVTVRASGALLELLYLDFTITHTLGQPPICTFKPLGWTPFVGLRITIAYAEPNNLEFVGTILQMRPAVQGASSDAILWECTAVGDQWLLDRFDKVRATYTNRGVSTIVGDILARFTDGGFRPGYIPQSLGNLTITFTNEVVSTALARIAAAVDALVELTPDKRINLCQAPAEAPYPTVTKAQTEFSSLDFSYDLSQVRTRALFEGAGSEVALPVEAGASTIPVKDIAVFPSSGKAIIGTNLLTYWGVSGSSLTGVSGLLEDVAVDTAIQVVAEAIDGGAEAALAFLLGGGLSGQATHYLQDGRLSAEEAAGRALSDVSIFGSALTDLSWRYMTPPRRVRVGRVVTVAIASPPIGITGDFIIQSVEITPRAGFGGRRDDVWRRVKTGRFQRHLSDLLAQLPG